MKRMLLVLSAVLFLAMLLVPSTPASAATARCTASPSSGPIGTVFVVSCSGFVAGEPVTAWLTEPDGHALWWASGKAGSGGDAAFAVPSKFSFASIAYGQWSMTIKGASGLIGIGNFFVTGGTVGVSGATLIANGTHISGLGFLPGEIVSVWADTPNGDCSGFAGSIGIGTEFIGDIKAGTGGSISFSLSASFAACTGTYHVVARGNTSRLGAEVDVVVTGGSVTPTVTLVANPKNAFVGDVVVVSGTGFLPGEPVTCWDTSPLGQNFQAFVGKAGSGGDIAVGIFTDFIGGSRGASGEWRVTCKGEASGLVGVAVFTLTGLPVDP